MKFWVGSFFLTVASVCAKADVSLYDKDELRVILSGFVETDIIHDSVRSFNETMGSSPVDLRGTLNGENGRTMFSNRNSRLAFSVQAPPQNNWRARGLLEMDFLGYEPNVNSGTPNVTESGFYSNPALRIRHAFLSAENGSWTFTIGQMWSLFGWQPNYFLVTASVAPGPGILYQRTIQAMLLKSFTWEQNLLVAGVSLARPSQRDSELPNIDLGVRYAFLGRRSGLATANGNANTAPMSVALSTSFRQFKTPKSVTDNSGSDSHGSSAIAVNTLVPIIASRDNDVSHSLSWTAEYSAGTGYGDEFPGWSGNLAAMPVTAATDLSSKINLDPGYAGFNGGKFTLVKLKTWSSQLQYHFSKETNSFMGLGYAELKAENMSQLQGSAAANRVLYDKSSFYFINYFKDITTQWRIGLEYSREFTHYITGQKPHNDRYQSTIYFRF